MKLTSSHPFWSVNNGLPVTYPSLQRNRSFDAVVIGGGITGALVATGFEAKELLKAGAGTLKSTYALISEPLESIPGWHQRCLIGKAARRISICAPPAKGASSSVVKTKTS